MTVMMVVQLCEYEEPLKCTLQMVNGMVHELYFNEAF